MDLNIEKSLESINNDHVQDMIKHLSSYGLGVCIPHMHTNSGEIISLPSGVVQKESSLQISFTDDSLVNSFDTPVAWRWNNNGIEVIAYCKLEYPDGPHK